MQINQRHDFRFTTFTNLLSVKPQKILSKYSFLYLKHPQYFHGSITIVLFVLH